MSKPNNTRRCVLTFQDFNKGMPTTLMTTYEVESELPILKAFKYSVARMMEEKFMVKPEKHFHD